MKKLCLGFFVLLSIFILFACSQSRSSPKDLDRANQNPYNITHLKSQRSIDLVIKGAKGPVDEKQRNQYFYTDSSNREYGAGIPLVLDQGDQVRIRVHNQTATKTNVHWHGLLVPNDQDGPNILIDPKGSHIYDFQVKAAGTYWAHSHDTPVADQVGRGMYAPLVVRSPEDKKYDLDQIFVLANRGSNGQDEMMGRDSGVRTVNGLSNGKMTRLTLGSGQVAKLRLINADVAVTKTVKFPFKVRVTHQDGLPLSKSYLTREVRIFPSGRVDVEVIADPESQGKINAGGVGIPVIFLDTGQAKGKTLYHSPASTQPERTLLDRTPDFRLSLSGGMGTMGGMMGSKEMSSNMKWTINGEVYPKTGSMSVKIGKIYKIEFINSSMMAVGHPMHIHGAHFQILSLNGRATRDDTWYDTYLMPPNQAVQIGVRFDQPGVWLVHCHNLAHEDAGMMTSFTVTDQEKEFT